ncbi:MAG: hypothetical protein DRP00_05270 [Candidatus Aenigmatarchaeota archaeon]|nr:MAG: hypothetical protein DRP00_05270 [Candidatus Aenigmarchaeota archaeon]
MYYPIQREIIEQSAKDWDKSDSSTMMIRINAVPLNYDLVIEEDDLEFEKGWTFPIIGEEVKILNERAIGYLFNKGVLTKLLGKDKVSLEDWKECEQKFIESKPEENPRVGIIAMFPDTKIPLLVDFEDLIRYHFGVFAFTGGGKSNLVANLVRKAFLHKDDIKVVIFDISCEYIVLLLDLLCKEDSSRIILDREIENAEDLDKSIVKPKPFEKEEIRNKIRERLSKLIEEGKIKVLSSKEKKTYSQIINLLVRTKEGYEKDGRPQAFLVDQMLEYLSGFLMEREKDETSEVTPEELEEIISKFKEILDQSGMRYKPDDIPKALKSWMEVLRERGKEGENVITIDELLERLESDEKELIVLNIPDPVRIRELAILVTREILSRRKRKFKISPFILFVFDEAQEFIKARGKAEEAECSEAIEDLSRHGRKYGLGVCISTQRIAHLNTNVLQQLHTYFVGTLPRPYDRGLISDVCTIDKDILDKTLEFGKGEWLVSSHSATGMPNVPIFVKADNTEDVLLDFLGCRDV